MIEPLLQAERLLLHGMVEQAEQIYRRVAEQDPLNSIAVVGLARVALERGDDEAALAHARAALAIDAQNAAAVRLEARLSEVLTERRRATEPPVSEPRQTPSVAAPAAPGDANPPVPGPDARPSEAAVFTRNPSMADHRRREGEPADTRPLRSPEESASVAEPAPAGQRRGLLDRLLRRGGGA